MRLTHIRLLVDNYKECFLFYRDVLGFEVTWGDENRCMLILKAMVEQQAGYLNDNY